MVRDQKVLFAGPKVYWEETYAVKKHDDDTPNEMWATRPRGQLDKCAEAAALRTAFPEEIGSDYIPEEVQHGNPKSKESIDALIGHEARTLDMIANEIEQPEPEPSQSGPLPPPDDDDDGPPNEARDDWSVFMGAVRAAKTLSDLKTTGDYWLKRDWGAARNTEALKVIAEREADIRAGKSKGKGTMFDKGNPPA
jgi:hypothetical protein